MPTACNASRTSLVESRLPAVGAGRRSTTRSPRRESAVSGTFDSSLVGPAVPLRIPGDASSPRDGACRHDGDRLRRRGDGWRGRMRHVPASRRRHWKPPFPFWRPWAGPWWPYVDRTIARIALGLVGAAPWYRPRRSAGSRSIVVSNREVASSSGREPATAYLGLRVPRGDRGH